MAGRTSFWAHDAAWHRRERQVMLGMEFGAVGPNVLAVLHSWAQEQKHTGEVKGGFTTLARETFADNAGQTRTVVEFAAKVGALDDLSVSADGLLFTARISGWSDEQPGAQDTVARRGRRARAAQEALENEQRTEPDTSGQARTTSDDVRKCPPTIPNQTRPKGERESASAPPAGDPSGDLSSGLRSKLDAIAATGNDKFRGAWMTTDGPPVVALFEVFAVSPEHSLQIREKTIEIALQWLALEAPRWKWQAISHSFEYDRWPRCIKQAYSALGHEAPGSRQSVAASRDATRADRAARRASLDSDLAAAGVPSGLFTPTAARDFDIEAEAVEVPGDLA